MAPHILKELEDVMRKIQSRIAVERSPEHQFALLHLVEGLSLEDWKQIADKFHVQGWLALPIDKADGMPLHVLRTTLEELTYQRDHDTLTGLANRRLFDRQINLEMQRALRTDTPLSLAMLDLDNFKDVNDTHGHATGDNVLVTLGDLLTRTLRVYDVAARLGGEEFCLLLPGASTRQAADLVTRILEDFRCIPFEAPEGEVFFTSFSAGVVTTMGSSAQNAGKELLAQADALLYEAKHQGKNRVMTMGTKHSVSENPALVQATEKQFLFTGKHIQ